MYLVSQVDQLFQTVEDPGTKSLHFTALRNKASSDFINKIKCIHSLPRDAILGRVDVVGMYLSVPYKIGLNDALRQIKEKRDSQIISTENIVKIAGFIFKNYF